MEYTITKNEQHKSIEIAFSGKPSEAVRDALKGLRFRWHGQKKVWYGYATEDAARAAIEGKEAAEETHSPAEITNKYGVKVGDIFHSSWGYEQTNNDYFQVVALVGTSSVRVREVHLPIIETQGIGPMSEDRVCQVVRDILPPSPFSVFIKDQEKGDLKRLKSWAADGVSNPCFKLASFTDAHLVTGDTLKVYESWYA